MDEVCTCISRPTRPNELGLERYTWVFKIRSSCLVHFHTRPARIRLNIMIREITEGE